MTATLTGRLARIAAVGNADRQAGENWITCADGFTLSVVAGRGAYCTPRPTLWADLPVTGEASHGYPGPYTHVEVGFPSDVPEPWTCHHTGDCYDSYGPDMPNEGTGWECYAEARSDPTGTVYARVPVAMVAALIAAHGGEA